VISYCSPSFVKRGWGRLKIPLAPFIKGGIRGGTFSKRGLGDLKLLPL